jgi:hypothetical protein
MAKVLLLVWSTPASGESDAEFHDWYDNTHLPELRAALPSITEVHRYRSHPIGKRATAAAPKAGRFLNIYELDQEDAAAASEAFNAAMASGRVGISDVVDIGEHAPVLEWYDHL